MTERSSIFDMIGPVMIGPSSSHTAGVVRIGRVMYDLLGGRPDTTTITFYNSFAQTYEGHGSDRAVLAGLLGLATDDDRLRDSPELAQQQGLAFKFRSAMNPGKLHPNSLRIEAQRGEVPWSLVGVSRGGGLITIAEVDGYHANFTGQLDTLVIYAQDQPGSIAYIANVVQHDQSNIATLTVGRTARNDMACLIFEIDSPLRPLTIDYLRDLAWVRRVRYIKPVG